MPTHLARAFPGRGLLGRGLLVEGHGVSYVPREREKDAPSSYCRHMPPSAKKKTNAKTKTSASRWPPLLGRVEKAARAWGDFAPDFAFERSGTAGAALWFPRGQKARARALHVFGRSETGSLFALWTADSSQLAKAPVAMLGDEGEAKVVAGGIAEFFALLALGVDFALDDYDRPLSHAKRHASFVRFLKEAGVALPKHPARVVAAARLAHPGLAEVIAGKSRAAAASRAKKVPAPRANLPRDAVELLNAPPPNVKLGKTSGVQLSMSDAGLVETVFLTPGSVGSKLTAGGHCLLGATRASVAATLGKASVSKLAWDRFNRNDVAFHCEYGDGAHVTMLTLMWLPAMPAHLR